MKYLRLIYGRAREAGDLSGGAPGCRGERPACEGDHPIVVLPFRSGHTAPCPRGDMSAVDGPFAETKEHLGG